MLENHDLKCPICNQTLKFGSMGMARCCDKYYQLKRKMRGEGKTAKRFEKKLRKLISDYFKTEISDLKVFYPEGFYLQNKADVQCVTGSVYLEGFGSLSFGSWDTVTSLVKGMGMEYERGEGYADIVLFATETTG